MSKKIGDIIMEAVNQISEKFQEDALDGDEVEVITERFRIELDLNQGNITMDDYDYKYSKDNWHHWFKE